MGGRLSAILVATLAVVPLPAFAHPHVFVEGVLEILRDGNGAVTELRHVWRFDELFSSTVLLDFDDNGDGKLDDSELEEVSKTVTESIGEYNFYTEVRLGAKPQTFTPPEKIMVNYDGGQITMFFAEKMKEPLAIAGADFRVAVSDPTYYVAMDFADESAVRLVGNDAGCKTSILRPDFDKLYAKNPATLTEQFFNNSGNAVLGDEWLTWIKLDCQ